MLAHLTGSGGLKIRRAVFEILLAAELVPGELISMPPPPPSPSAKEGGASRRPGGGAKTTCYMGSKLKKHKNREKTFQVVQKLTFLTILPLIKR